MPYPGKSEEKASFPGCESFLQLLSIAASAEEVAEVENPISQPPDAEGGSENIHMSSLLSGPASILCPEQRVAVSISVSSHHFFQGCITDVELKIRVDIDLMLL